LRRVVRFGCFASVVAAFLFLAGAFSQGSAEPARPEAEPKIEATASTNSTSSNSSSGTIMITMMGMAGDPGDLGP
jgi:predicted nicotinamide N-methyase